MLIIKIINHLYIYQNHQVNQLLMVIKFYLIEKILVFLNLDSLFWYRGINNLIKDIKFFIIIMFPVNSNFIIHFNY